MLLRSNRLVPQPQDSRGSRSTSQPVKELAQREEPRTVNFSTKGSQCSISSSTVDQKRRVALPPFTYYDHIKPTVRPPLRRSAYRGQMSAHQPVLPQEKSLSTVHCSSQTHGQSSTASRGRLSSCLMKNSLLLIILMGLIAWLVLPLEMSFIPGRDFALCFSRLHLESQSVATESVALNTNQEHISAERQRQKEQELSQYEDKVKQALQEITATMENEGALKTRDFQTKSEAAVDSLRLIIETLEAQHKEHLLKLNSLEAPPLSLAGLTTTTTTQVKKLA